MPTKDNDAAAQSQTATVIAATSGPIERDAKNPHAKFTYASADAVYAAVRGPLGEAGLIPWVHEEKTELITPQGQSKPTIWVRSTFRVGLAPVSPPPDFDTFERVTVWDRLNSPQTSQALRTYALKYYLRGKLLLSTGEPDIDASAGKKGGKRRKRTGDPIVVIDLLAKDGPTLKELVDDPDSASTAAGIREALIAAHKADIPRERLMAILSDWETWRRVLLGRLRGEDYDYIMQAVERYKSVSEAAAEAKETSASFKKAMDDAKAEKGEGDAE